MYYVHTMNSDHVFFVGLCVCVCFSSIRFQIDHECAAHRMDPNFGSGFVRRMQQETARNSGFNKFHDCFLSRASACINE